MTLIEAKQQLLKQRAVLDQIEAWQEYRNRQNWWISGSLPPDYDPELEEGDFDANNLA